MRIRRIRHIDLDPGSRGRRLDRFGIGIHHIDIGIFQKFQYFVDALVALREGLRVTLW